MKPLSPILLLTAVQAAALRVRLAAHGTDCALQFVNAMGYLAHLHGTFDASSWPLQRVRSVAELLARASEADMIRLDAEAGDLVTFRRADFPSVGVVLAVLEQGIGPVGRTIKCRVIFATSSAHGRLTIACRDLWCRPGSGDRFVRWCAGRTAAILRRMA